MLAAFVGHLYPIFFKFVGGKGVATAFGVWLGAQPLLMLAAGLTWLLTAWLFRYSSLASLVVALVVPLLYVFAPLWTVQPALALSLVAMSVLLIGRHAENIRRLRQGTESRLGKPKPIP
jgi:glycerol-3-phosphate acyltransferase PlsY